MKQQSIELDVNAADETLLADLNQTMHRVRVKDLPDTLLIEDAAGNRPKKPSLGCHNTGVHHVGLHASKPAASAEFYRDVLGMEIVGGSSPGHPFGATAFLSSRPDEESHEIALFSDPALAHIAFKTSSLAELRSLYARVAQRRIPIKFVVNHGVSFAFYFADPDRNMIEVYWPTGYRSGQLQPHMERLDLTQPDEALLKKVTAQQPQAAGSPLRKASLGCRNTGLHHVGLHATDPATSAEFYRDVLGMEIVGGSDASHPLGASAFLSSRPDEESHEIALFANPAHAHCAFKVSSLVELRSRYARVAERNIPIKFSANHGVSFAFYFYDLDGNMIEVYWPTGDLSRRQPQMEPLDLSQPDEVLLEKIKPRQARAFAAANGGATVVERDQPKYVAAGTSPAYWGPGDQITFLITGDQTGGAFFMAEVSVPPGGGPPPHIHRREEETFYLQQGTLAIQVGGKTLQASPGDCVYLPRGIMHCFKNTGNMDAKFLMVVTPAGLENFFAESFYRAQDRSAAPPLITEAMLDRLLTAAARHGLEFSSPA